MSTCVKSEVAFIFVASESDPSQHKTIIYTAKVRDFDCDWGNYQWMMISSRIKIDNYKEPLDEFASIIDFAPNCLLHSFDKGSTYLRDMHGRGGFSWPCPLHPAAVFKLLSHWIIVKNTKK